MVCDSISLVIRRISEIGYRTKIFLCGLVDSRSLAGALVSPDSAVTRFDIPRRIVARMSAPATPVAAQDLQQFRQEAARAAMTLNGLAQKGRRASHNRSLLSS